MTEQREQTRNVTDEAGEPNGRTSTDNVTTAENKMSKWDIFLAVGKFVAAALIILALAGFIVYLLSKVSVTPKQWERAIYLYSGVEALAFAAAGYLFGREVNRGTAQQAQKRAQEANGQANQAEQRSVDDKTRANQAERQRVESVSELGGVKTVATAYATRFNDIKAKVKHADETFQSRGAFTPSVMIMEALTDDMPRVRNEEDEADWTAWSKRKSTLSHYLTEGGENTGEYGIVSIEDLKALQEQQSEREQLHKEIRELVAIVDQPLLPEEIQP